MMRNGECLTDILLHEQHSYAGFMNALDDAEVLPYLKRRKAERGLIDDKEPWGAHHPATD